MILIFGGTTEGRAAVNVIEEAGKPYYYSTKGDEQDIYLHHGIRLSGAMTRRTLKAFCRQNDIRLLIDADHPFAEKMHDTVTDVAHDLGIPCIRYERITTALTSTRFSKTTATLMICLLNLNMTIGICCAS